MTTQINGRMENERDINGQKNNDNSSVYMRRGSNDDTNNTIGRNNRAKNSCKNSPTPFRRRRRRKVTLHVNRNVSLLGALFSFPEFESNFRNHNSLTNESREQMRKRKLNSKLLFALLASIPAFSQLQRYVTRAERSMGDDCTTILRVWYVFVC